MTERPGILTLWGNSSEPAGANCSWSRGATPTHEHLRSRVAFLFVASVVLDVVASVVILVFERHADRTENHDARRLLDLLVQAYAISVVAALAGSFGAFLHRRGLERDPSPHADDRPA